MKRSFFLGLLVTAAMARAVAASPITAVSSTEFLDPNTGLTWLTLAPDFNLTYAQQLAAMPAGFEVATQADMVTLEGDMSGSSFAYNNSVIMGSTTRDLLWGNSYDASTGVNDWTYQYEGDSWTSYNPSTEQAYSDLGLWANNGAQVAAPELGPDGPMCGVALLCCSGLAIAERRKRSK